MNARVLLGFGGNVDVEIRWDSAEVARLAEVHRVTQAELDTSVEVVDERTLLVSILAFLRAGQGGERFVADEQVLHSFPSHFAHRWTLGGTGIRAALTMDLLGISSTVHLVSTNDIVRDLLPAGIQCLSSATGDSLHPHLIVQFPHGARVQTPFVDVTAPRANRLIYVNDPPNRDLVLSDALAETAPSLDAMLVTGLNSMQDAALVADRLDRISEAVAAMPEHRFVMFEDAGQHVPELGREVLARMSKIADVVSMNEDELFGHLGAEVDLHDAARVEAALRTVRDRIGVHTLVVHTQHWAAALGAEARELRGGLQSGVLTAGARYVFGDDVSLGDIESMSTSPRQAEATEFATRLERANDLSCVPAFDLQPSDPTTIGLGDTFVGGFMAAHVKAHLKEGAVI